MELETLEGNQVATLLTPTTIALVTAKDGAGDCIATCAWANPVSHAPAMVGVCLRPGGRTARAIVEGGAFVVNVLPVGEQAAAVACGKKGPDQPERFESAGLTKLPSSCVEPVRVSQAMSWIECKLVEHHAFGDHELYVGEVALAQTQGGEPLLMSGRSAFGRFTEE